MPSAWALSMAFHWSSRIVYNFAFFVSLPRWREQTGQVKVSVDMFVFAEFSSLVLSKVLNRMIPPLMGIMNLFVYSLKATQFVHPAVGLIVWPVFLLIGWWFSFSIFYYESWSKMCDPELWRLSAWPGNWALLLARRLIPTTRMLINTSKLSSLKIEIRLCLQTESE